MNLITRKKARGKTMAPTKISDRLSPYSVNENNLIASGSRVTNNPPNINKKATGDKIFLKIIRII